MKRRKRRGKRDEEKKKKSKKNKEKKKEEKRKARKRRKNEGEKKKKKTGKQKKNRKERNRLQNNNKQQKRTALISEAQLRALPAPSAPAHARALRTAPIPPSRPPPALPLSRPSHPRGCPRARAPCPGAAARGGVFPCGLPAARRHVLRAGGACGAGGGARAPPPAGR